MIYIELKTNIVSKKNSRINTKSGRSFPSKKYSEFHQIATYQIMEQKVIPVDPIKQVSKIEMIFYYGDKRRRDCDNSTSSVLDLLTDCGIIEDDNYEVVKELSIKGFYRKKNPGCEIFIHL